MAFCIFITSGRALTEAPQLPHIYKLISAIVPIIISQGVSAALQNYLLKVLSFLQPEFVHLVLM